MKRSGILRQLNAVVKNIQLEGQSRRVSAEYRRKLTAHGTSAAKDVRLLISTRMASAGVTGLEGLSRRPRIFLVGTDYEQERAGFIQALERAGSVVPLRTSSGRYGLKPPAHPGDLDTIRENSRQIIEQVAAERLNGPLDVLIGTMVAQSLSIEALQHVRRLGIPVLNMAMDDRLVEHWGWRGSTRVGSIGLAPAVDLVLQTTREYVPRYLVDGHPAVYWPFWSDPMLFRPGGVKRYDVCFVGNNYGWRGALLRQIAAAGICVECFGSGFPNGHINADSVAKVFAESRIILGIGTIAHSRHIVTLKLRDFDGPMSGALYLTTANPDLQDSYVIGKEIEVYRSPQDCIRLLRYYLANASEREAIASAGRARAARDHTWDQRIAQALELIGLPENVAVTKFSQARHP